MAKAVILSDTNIYSHFGFGRYVGPYAVASYARQQGHEVVVIDYFTKHPNLFKYLETFLCGETVAVGISSTFLAPTPKSNSFSERTDSNDGFFEGELWFNQGSEVLEWTEKLKALLKQKTKSAKLVLGGVKSQYAIWRPEFYSNFDYVFVGAAERSFSELLTNLERSIEPKSQVKNGICFIDNKFDIENKFCPALKLEKADTILRGESLPIEISRGCAFNCKFCHYNKTASFKKSILELKDEFVRNYELFETTTYSFSDDCFNDHPKKVSDYCEMFLSLPFKIEWVSYARVDVPVKFPWTLDLMIKSGARGLYWGIESFDHEVARNAGKGTPPDKVKELLFRLSTEFKNECLTEISLITGLPGETHESLEQSLKWLLKNPVADLLNVGSLGLTPYVEDLDKTLFDYAEYSRNPQKYGFKKVQFNPKYWEHDTMNMHEAKEWARRYQKEYYSQRKYLPIKSIWTFPHLKTLGLSTKAAFSLYRDDNNDRATRLELHERFEFHLYKYWTQLQQNHFKQQSFKLLSTEVF